MAVPLNGRPERRHLIVFIKAPRLGRVKSRLARDLGTVDAWAFYRRTTEAVIRRVAADPRWRTRLAITPPQAIADGCRWPSGLRRFPQRDGDLGRRMYEAMRSASPGPVVLVGGDIPDLEPRHVAEAFRQLGSHDLVLGPATDGGFWLVGARRTPSFPFPFGGVRWSHPETLSDTLAAARPRLKAGLVAMLHDIDDGESLRRWAELRRRGASRAPAGAA